MLRDTIKFALPIISMNPIVNAGAPARALDRLKQPPWVVHAHTFLSSNRPRTHHPIFVLDGLREFVYKQNSHAIRKAELFCLFLQTVHKYEVNGQPSFFLIDNL